MDETQGRRHRLTFAEVDSDRHIHLSDENSGFVGGNLELCAGVV